MSKSDLHFPNIDSEERACVSGLLPADSRSLYDQSKLSALIKMESNEVYAEFVHNGVQLWAKFMERSAQSE